MSTVGCGGRDDALCGLALGILSGDERAELLAHVESCQRCTTLLEQLSVVADGMLELAPEAEPPLGLEVRVLAELRRHQPARRHRARRLLAAAAVVLLAGAFGVGLLTAHGRTAGPSAVALASFHSGSTSAGEALAYPGNPGRLLVTLDGLDYSGDVRCMLVTTSGRRYVAGTFWLSHGYGWWGVNLPTGASTLQSAVLESSGPHPTVIAEASFHPAS